MDTNKNFFVFWVLFSFFGFFINAKSAFAYTTINCYVAHQFRFDQSWDFHFNAVEKNKSGWMAIGMDNNIADSDGSHYRGYYSVFGSWVPAVVESETGMSLYMVPANIGFSNEGNYRVAAYFENIVGGESYYCGNAGVEVYRSELPNNAPWLGTELTAAYGVNGNKYRSPAFTTASGNQIAGISYQMDSGSCSSRGPSFMFSQMIPIGDSAPERYQGCVTSAVYDGYVLAKGKTYNSANFEMELVMDPPTGCTAETCWVKAKILPGSLRLYTRGSGFSYPLAPLPLMKKNLTIRSLVVTPKVSPGPGIVR
jgi:hypothetical protein